MCRLTGRELDIINLRNVSGMTFHDISKKYGFSTERARQIYHRALEKKRLLKEIEMFCPEFFKVNREMKFDSLHFFQLCTILKKHRLIESGDWKNLDDWDYLSIEGIGPKYMEFLRRAKELRRINYLL